MDINLRRRPAHALLASAISLALTAGSARAQEQAESGVEEVVVYGSRAAQQSSLAKQRAADNIATVLSSDISGKFPDSTVAESMRRAPGISFQRSERGGEGEFISIRGLDSALNNVKINGVNAGGDRRVPFDVFQAGTISEIVVNKTLLPEHDGSGIGGAIELNTRNPLQARGRSADLSLEGRYNEFRDKAGYTASGSFIDTFGSDNQFAVLAAGSYRKRYIQSFVFDVLGDYMPGQIPLTPDPDGSGVIDRQDTVKWQQAFGPDFTAASFPSGEDLRIEDMRANLFDLTRENTSGTLAFGWQASSSTQMLLTGNYNESTENNLRSTIGFEQSERYDVSTDPANFFGSSPFLRVRGEVEDEESSSGAFALTFTTGLDRWLLDYGAGYSFATAKTPGSAEVDFTITDLDDDDPLGTGPLLDPVAPTGQRFIDFARGGDIPVPSLTAAGWAALGNPAAASFSDLLVFTDDERNDRYSMFFGGQYDIGGNLLQAIKLGVKAERSDFRETGRDQYDDDALSADGTIGDGDFTLADTGLLAGGVTSLDNIGNPFPQFAGMPRYSRQGILAFRDNALASLPAGTLLPLSELDTREDIYAAYLQAVAGAGDVRVIGGARVEHVETQTGNFFTVAGDLVDEGAAATGRFDSDGSYTRVFPRLQVNYRPSGNRDLVIRGAAFTSMARPDLDDLGRLDIAFVDEIVSSGSSTSVEENLVFSLPNPALKPAYAYNFDLGAEYYLGRSGIVSLNLFYKRIDNFIFNGVTRTGASSLTPEDLAQIPGFQDVDFTAFDDVVVLQKTNGERATVSGVEANFIFQLAGHVEGWLGGFGTFANFTLQDAKTRVPITGSFTRRVPFFNSPDYIGNVALTYEKYGLDASLSYSFQDSQLDSVEPFMNLDEYERPYSSLDLSIQYSPAWLEGWTIFGQVNDIANDGSRAINDETKGNDSPYLDDNEFIGREFRFGTRVRF